MRKLNFMIIGFFKGLSLYFFPLGGICSKQTQSMKYLEVFPKYINKTGSDSRTLPWGGAAPRTPNYWVRLSQQTDFDYTLKTLTWIIHSESNTSEEISCSMLYQSSVLYICRCRSGRGREQHKKTTMFHRVLIRINPNQGVPGTRNMRCFLWLPLMITVISIRNIKPRNRPWSNQGGNQSSFNNVSRTNTKTARHKRHKNNTQTQLATENHRDYCQYSIQITHRQSYSQILHVQNYQRENT